MGPFSARPIVACPACYAIDGPRNGLQCAVCGAELMGCRDEIDAVLRSDVFKIRAIDDRWRVARAIDSKLAALSAGRDQVREKMKDADAVDLAEQQKLNLILTLTINTLLDLRFGLLGASTKTD